jgi:hypothetical protein
MSDFEIQSWISQQATSRRPALTVRRRHPSDGPFHIVRVALAAGSATAAKEQLADLMMDMRLLGLRPTVVSRTDERFVAESEDR